MYRFSFWLLQTNAQNQDTLAHSCNVDDKLYARYKCSKYCSKIIRMFELLLQACSIPPPKCLSCIFESTKLNNRNYLQHPHRPDWIGHCRCLDMEILKKTHTHIVFGFWTLSSVGTIYMQIRNESEIFSRMHRLFSCYCCFFCLLVRA